MKIHYKLALTLLVGAALGAAALQGLHAQTKSPAYVVIEVEESDHRAYLQEYASLAVSAMVAGGGKFLARGGKTFAIDGEAPKPRVMVIAFESMEKAKATFAGVDYRSARKIGDEYAKFRIWAVEGLPQ